MEKGTEIYSVEKIIGGLRQINLGVKPIIANRYYNKFYAEKEFIREWQHYGQYIESRIHLYVESETGDTIKIGNIEFLPIVSDIYFYLKSYYNDQHNFTVNGRNTITGEVFNRTFHIKGDDLIPRIIYAMCLISHFENAEIAGDYWKACHNYNGCLDYSTKGELLDKVIKFKNASEKMVTTYPFMQSFLQECLKKLVSDLKESLDSLSILK